VSTKGWGRFLVGVGLCATLAANVAHAVREAGTGGVTVLALGFAAVWPLGLLGCSEVLFRMAFRGARDYVTAAAVAAVGLGAGFISFGHSKDLLASELGESSLAGVLGAIAIDGLLVVGGLTLYGESRHAVPAAQAARRVPAAQAARVAHAPVPRPVPAAQAQAAQVAQAPVPRPVPPVQGVPLQAVQGDPVRELKAQGKSVRAIAEELSISPSTVQRRLKAAG
jgi:hypothetical protein